MNISLIGFDLRVPRRNYKQNTAHPGFMTNNYKKFPIFWTRANPPEVSAPRHTHEAGGRNELQRWNGGCHRSHSQNCPLDAEFTYSSRFVRLLGLVDQVDGDTR